MGVMLKAILKGYMVICLDNALGEEMYQTGVA
jgi:hypothetical protein